MKYGVNATVTANGVTVTFKYIVLGVNSGDALANAMSWLDPDWEVTDIELTEQPQFPAWEKFVPLPGPSLPAALPVWPQQHYPPWPSGTAPVWIPPGR